MQRIGNLKDWKRLAAGDGLEFSRKRARLVRLRVNAPEPTRLLYVNEQGEVSFLALVTGLDEVEFFADGPFGLGVESGECYVLTGDSQYTHMEKTDFRSFTEVWERRPRNYEFELMQYVARINMEKRMGEIAAAAERKVAEYAEQLKSTIPSSQTGGTGNSQGQEQGGGSGESGGNPPQT